MKEGLRLKKTRIFIICEYFLPFFYLEKTEIRIEIYKIIFNDKLLFFLPYFIRYTMLYEKITNFDE